MHLRVTMILESIWDPIENYPTKALLCLTLILRSTPFQLHFRVKECTTLLIQLWSEGGVDGNIAAPLLEWTVDTSLFFGDFDNETRD